MTVNLTAKTASAARAAHPWGARRGARCHGERLRNPGGGTSFDLRRLKPEDYARFVNSVLNGKNSMPPWRGVLDPAQIDAIWAFIRAMVDR